MSYFIGRMQRRETKNGKVMFEGNLKINLPVKGFLEKEDPNIVHLAIDKNKLEYLLDVSDKPQAASVKKEKEQPQEELQEAVE